MSPQHALRRVVLRAASGLFGAVVRLRNDRYDRPGASIAVDAPVVSVGNVTVGGTGKTPIVALLAARLAELGRRPAIVSRGYRGTAGSGPVVVSTGRGPTVGPDRAGDEPFLLARQLPDALVVVGSNRVGAAREAIRLGADVVLLDDGFQHRRIRRDVDLVLIDRDDPFGGDALLPEGRLREPVSSLARADVAVVTRCTPSTPIETIRARLASVRVDLPVIRAGHRTVGFVSRTGNLVPRPDRAVAFCAIGSPAAFGRDLEEAGVDVCHSTAFRDHHPYRQRDLDPLVRRAENAGAVLVTTEKDLARLEREDAPDVGNVVALRIEAVVHDPGPLLARITRALECT